MKLFLLSYFDMHQGPHVFLKYHQDITKAKVSEQELKQIALLIDVYSPGFYIHSFGDYKTANYIFEIESQLARGGSDMILASIVYTEGDINENLSKDLLAAFAEEVGKIDQIYYAFYKVSGKEEICSNKLGELKDLCKTFYEDLPEESVVIKKRAAKIFVFGPSKAGKTTIINCLRKEFSNVGGFGETIPTTHVNITKLMLGDFQFLTYDSPGQKKFRSLWAPYLKDQDGLVFIIDVVDDDRFADAKEMLNQVLGMPMLRNLPLLILFNKIDISHPNISKLTHAIGLDEIEKRNFKYFLTSGLINEGITEAFDWFANIITQKINPKRQEVDVSLILAKWDDEEGPAIVSLYPKKTFEDPESVMMRCFSISEFVFGGEKFKRTSLIIPLVHLNMKASIHFDYIIDNTVRGGRLPVMFAIFYSDKIPIPIIEQFNSEISDEINVVKNEFSDSNAIEDNLKKIYDNLFKKLHEITPTIRSLQVAEKRYQLLFKAATDAILIIDQKTQIIVDANDQVEKMFQRPREDNIGINIDHLQAPEIEEPLFSTIMEFINSKTVIPIEIQLRKANGELFFVELSASSIRMGGQSLIQCFFRDITERKRSEETLKASEALNRGIVESNPFPIIIFNKGLVRYINSTFISIFGYTLNEIPNGKEWSRKAYPDKVYRHSVIARFKEYSENPNKDWGLDPFVFDVTDNEGKIHRTVFHPVKLPNDDEFFILEDITPRITAEKQRKKIVDANPFPIIVFQNGGVEYINQKFTQSFGYKIEDIPNGKEWARNAYPDPEYRHEVIAKFKEYAQNPDKDRGLDPFSFEVTDKGGSVHFVVFHPVQLEDNKQFFIMEDNTKRKIAESQRQAIIDNNPFPIIVFKEGNVAFINKKFTELLGYTFDDIPNGKEWARKAYPDSEYRHEVIAKFKEYTQNPDLDRGIDPFTFNVTDKNGAQHRCVFNPVQLRNGSEFFIIEDITNRVKK